MKEIYTDGSCKGNPGSGSWGAIVVEDGVVIEAIQSEIVPDTTNNRMEMAAILWAKNAYGSFFINVPIVYTDSSYALNSFTNWIKGWKNNGWKKSDGSPLENLDLIKMYDRFEQLGMMIDLRKISGHTGHQWNELADQLATRKITPKEILDKYGR